MERIKRKEERDSHWLPLSVILVVFMALDMLISWTAIIRQTLRHNHIPPYTPIGRFYDEHFTDDYLEHYFPNMRRPEEEE